MGLCVVETVQLELLGLPTLVVLVAKQHHPEYCTAEAFIVPPEGAADVALHVAIGEALVDEELAIAVAREVARTELESRLQALPAEERCVMIDFAPADTLRIRASRCLGKYPQLADIHRWSRDCYAEIRAFEKSVRAVRTAIEPLH